MARRPKRPVRRLILPEIRRILVVLDSGAPENRAAELATRLASAVSADIDALLVEDAAVRAAADLPFIRAISGLTGAIGGLTPEDVEVGFRVLNRSAQRRFEQLVRPAGLRWTFRSVRGNPGSQIAAAAMGADLLVLGPSLGTPLGIARMREIARQITRPVVFVGDVPSRHASVSIVFEGSDLNHGSIAIGSALARSLSGELTVYHPRQDRLAEEEVRAALSDDLTGPLRLRVVVSPSATALQIADIRRQAILIVPERSPPPA